MARVLHGMLMSRRVCYIALMPEFTSLTSGVGVGVFFNLRDSTGALAQSGTDTILTSRKPPLFLSFPSFLRRPINSG